MRFSYKNFYRCILHTNFSKYCELVNVVDYFLFHPNKAQVKISGEICGLRRVDEIVLTKLEPNQGFSKPKLLQWLKVVKPKTVCPWAQTLVEVNQKCGPFFFFFSVLKKLKIVFANKTTVNHCHQISNFSIHIIFYDNPCISQKIQNVILQDRMAYFICMEKL